MDDSSDRLLLVTGATGLVGSHVVERARREGIRTRALVRLNSNVRLLQKWDVEIVTGGMQEPYAIQAAMHGATHVVHCAAKLGDWGRIEPYRDVNVTGFQHLLEAASRSETLRRLVHISSMAVYEARDHFGTDETEPVQPDGVDAYAVTKVEAEQLLLEYVRRERVPGVILRPGWIYGPRDRTVIPRVVERLADGKFAFLGSGEQLLNNTYVGNLVDAIYLALEAEGAVGEAFNIRDPRLVSRHEFFGTVAELAGLPRPTRHIPLKLARILAAGLEATWRLLQRDEPPLLSQARIKLLGLNLDYSIEKARRVLGYNPQTDFTDGIRTTMEWFGRVES